MRLRNFIHILNDLPCVLSHARCLLYADDVNVILEIKSVEDFIALQSDVAAVYQWSLDNAMQFNTEKRHVASLNGLGIL